FDLPVRARAGPTTGATRGRRERPAPRSAARGVGRLFLPCQRTLLSGGREPRQLARGRYRPSIPETFALDVQHEVEARQGGDDVAVLLVQVLESGILTEGIHALPLAEDHPDRAVLEDHPCFRF